MKKTYKTPTMKVVEVQQRLLLSGSTLGIYGEVDKGKTVELYGSEYDDGAW